MGTVSKQTIIFDLDGTLVDASDRLYCLFQDLVPASNLTKSEYWRAKREGLSHKDILQKSFPETNVKCFNERWLSLIETQSYLALDKLYAASLEVLLALKGKSTLILLTARQSKSALLQELNDLRIKSFLDEIFITEGVLSKENQLLEIVSRCSSSPADLFLVSDAVDDIYLGNQLGIKTIGVNYGFTSSDLMRESCPSASVDSQLELLKVFK